MTDPQPTQTKQSNPYQWLFAYDTKIGHLKKLMKKTSNLEMREAIQMRINELRK